MRTIHGGDVWQGGAPEEYLDFSANLNPEGPPDWVRAAMAEDVARAAYYPDIRGRAALAGLSAHLDLPEDCLLPTNGGIEAAALAAGLAQGRGNLIAQPTFQEYGRLCGDWTSIPRERLMAPPFQGETIWVCNPNNPTGHAFSRTEMTALLARVEAAGGRLIVDEAFIDYCPEHSVANLCAAHPALIVLGSLTKVLAIPGIRLGYLVAHPSIIAQLRETLPPWRLNCVAEAVAAALPGRADDFRRIRTLNTGRRAAFAQALTGMGVRVSPSAANFLLCDFGRDMRPAIADLRTQKILVRPCGMFPGLTNAHIRLCVRKPADNAKLLAALKNAAATGNS